MFTNTFAVCLSLLAFVPFITAGLIFVPAGTRTWLLWPNTVTSSCRIRPVTDVSQLRLAAVVAHGGICRTLEPVL